MELRDTLELIGMIFQNIKLGFRTLFLRPKITFGPAFIIYAFVLICSLLALTNAKAQQALVIAATVNDSMISVLDVEARLTLSIHLAELPNTLETRKRLAAQTLRAIIDEKLKLEEAKKFKITVSRTNIVRSETEFERRAGLNKGELRKLLRQLGLDASSFLERLESQIAWTKLISRRYLSTINVSDKEIDDFIAELESSKGKPEYLVSEIFLPNTGGQSPDQIRNLAEKLKQQISRGANFSAIARNFSQSASAATGGNLGWNRDGQLAAELGTIIKSLTVGQVAGPIETLDGFYLLRLNNKRTIQPFRDEAPQPTTVTLHQAHFDLPTNADGGTIAKITANANQVAAGATSCAKLDELSKQSGSPLSGKLGTFKVNQLSTQLQNIVTPLPVSQASTPFRTANGIIVVMVCERKTPKVKKTSPAERRKEIKDQLIFERLDLAAEQFLRNLRRTAIVDIR
jgi:peptidyl-prolyl cis-trans isomerase SurA